MGTLYFLRRKRKKLQKNHLFLSKKVGSIRTTKIATGASLLWDTHQQEALERGNLIHELFSKITYATDLDTVLNDALQEGTLTAEQYELLQPQNGAIAQWQHFSTLL